MSEDLKAVLARLEKLEKENEVLKVQAATGPAKKQTTTVKINAKGGVFFSAPCMKAFSEAKGKDYQCGINIHAYQLTAFYAFMKDASLQKKVLACIENTIDVKTA